MSLECKGGCYRKGVKSQIIGKKIEKSRTFRNKGAIFFQGEQVPRVYSEESEMILQKIEGKKTVIENLD